MDRVLRQSKPVSRWDLKTRDQALKLARMTLAGIGEMPPEVIEEGEIAVHVRRKATQAEIALGAPWRKLKGRP